MKVTLQCLSVTVALVAAGTVLGACAPPEIEALPDTGSGLANKGDARQASAAKAKTGAGAASSTDEGDGDEEDEAPSKKGGGKKSCFDKCARQDTAAKAIQSKNEACMAKCRDTPCFAACGETLATACEADSAACETIDECNTECSPAEEEEAPAEDAPAEE